MVRPTVTIAGVSKSLDPRGLREFCPEGHRLFWPAHMSAIGRIDAAGIGERGSVNTGAGGYGVSSSRLGSINRGICTAGDYWVQQDSERILGPGLSFSRQTLGYKPRSGLERSTAPPIGSYDVSFNLDRETGEVIGRAALKCALGHVDLKQGKIYKPEVASADRRGYITLPSPAPCPDTVGEMNAYISGLLAENWQLRDGRLLCPKCVVAFDEVAHGLTNMQTLERLEHESSPKRYEYRIVYQKDDTYAFSGPEALVAGEVVRLVDEPHHRVAGHITIEQSNGKRRNVHPSYVKRVEIETD